MPGSNKSNGGYGTSGYNPGAPFGDLIIDPCDDIIFDQFEKFTSTQGCYGDSMKGQNKVISPVSEVFSCKTGANDFFGF
jgi:hypothetical protein